MRIVICFQLLRKFTWNEPWIGCYITYHTSWLFFMYFVCHWMHEISTTQMHARYISFHNTRMHVCMYGMFHPLALEFVPKQILNFSHLLSNRDTEILFPEQYLHLPFVSITNKPPRNRFNPIFKFSLDYKTINCHFDGFAKSIAYLVRFDTNTDVLTLFSKIILYVSVYVSIQLSGDFLLFGRNFTKL